MVSILLDRTGRVALGWRLAFFAACVLGLFFADTAITDIALGMVGALSGGQTPAFLGTELGVLCMVIFPTSVMICGLAVLCRKYVDRRSAGSMGLAQPGRRIILSVLAGLCLGLLAIGITASALLAAGALRREPSVPCLDPVILIPLLAAAAFAEEIVFRGYMLQNFFDSKRPTLGLLLTSVCFWLVHAFNPWSWSSPVISINLFGAGVLLGLAYRATGSLWFVSALHMGWNYAQGAVFGMPVSGTDFCGLLRLCPAAGSPATLTGGSFGLEGSLVTTAVEMFLIAAILAAIARRRQSIAGCFRR